MWVRNAETEEIDALGRKKYFLNNVVCNVRDGYAVDGWCMQTDITDLKQTQQALLQQERDRAQQLEHYNAELQQRDRILEAVTIATNTLLTVEDFQASVNTALQILGEALDTDRINTIENVVVDSVPSWRIGYEWDSPATVPQYSDPDAAQGSWAEVQWLYDLLQQGQSISYLIEETPEPFRSYQIAIGVKSTHLVPIYVEEQWWGVLGLDDCREAKRRSAAELAALKVAADCIGSAIQRQRTQQALLAAERDRAAELTQINQVLSLEIVERQRAEQLAQGQLEALTGILKGLSEDADLDKYLGQVMISIGAQLQHSDSSLWFTNHEAKISKLHLICLDGVVTHKVPPLQGRRPRASYPNRLFGK